MDHDWVGWGRRGDVGRHVFVDQGDVREIGGAAVVIGELMRRE